VEKLHFVGREGFWVSIVGWEQLSIGKLTCVGSDVVVCVSGG
jgi:hypothetical protein